MKNRYIYTSAAIICCLLFFTNVKAQVLSVLEIEQEQNQWCWAGVSQCVLDYYGFSNQQCDIAEYARSQDPSYFGSSNCCLTPTGLCNNPNSMFSSTSGITAILANFGSITTTNLGAALSQSEWQAEISNNTPLLIRYGWNGGGGHFVVGYGISGSDYYTMDPWFNEGYTISTYNWILTGQGGAGSWTHSQVLSSPPSSSSCGLDSVEIVITVNTDDYPTETSWELIDQNGGGYIISPGTLTMDNNTYTWNICVYDANCYSFEILDAAGDGICCAYGNGSYNVTYAGTTVASGGSFGFSDITSNIGYCGSPTPSWDCISPGNCQDPGTGNGTYSTFSQCQSACVVTPSWDCIPSVSGGCYDPGNGMGPYSSLAACLPNCPPDPSWDCDGQGVCSDPGTGVGMYSMLAQCQSACITPSWDCMSQPGTPASCYDPQDGSGSYSTLAACQANCITPTWDCDGMGNCIDPGDGSGMYIDEMDCLFNCIVASSWDCGATGCYDPGTGNGQYTSLASCQAVCGSPTPSWDCGATGCYDPGTGNGQYTSLASCQVVCGSQTSSWNCNGAGTCYDPGTGTGQYTSLIACEYNCALPQTWSCNPLTGSCEELFDGTGNYTNINQCEDECDLQLGIENKDIDQLTIFPNPTDQIVNIQFSIRLEQNIKIRLISAIGEIVFIENLHNYSGDYFKEINLDGYSKGIYLLEIETYDGILNNKIIRY